MSTTQGMNDQFRVLACEDDQALRQLLTIILRRAGVAVDAVDSGELALERMMADHYQLILLDLMLPCLNGLEIIEHLKRSRPDLLGKVVVVTAAGNGAIAGLDDKLIRKVIHKPFEINELLATVFQSRDERTAA